MCDRNNKNFNRWFSKKSSKKITKKVISLLHISESLTIDINKESKRIRGTYVHPNLIFHVAL